MKFYEINSQYFEGGTEYFADARDAKREAREAARSTGLEVIVDRVEVNTTKAGLVRLASGRGWCVSREQVYRTRGVSTHRKRETV